MSFGLVVSDIIHGTINHCCLCSQRLGENTVWIDDDIFIDSKETQTMSQLLYAVFGDDVLNAASSFGVFCDQCKFEIVNSYKFMKQCKTNLQMLSSVVDIMRESCENVLQEAESSRTVFIALKLHDFTTKQIYEDTIFEDKSTALNSFCSIKISTVNKNKNKSDKGRVNSAKIEGVQPKQNKPKDYDVPSFPTKDIVYDATDPTNYKCKVCLRKYMGEKSLRLHFFRYHCRKEVKCPKCPKRFIFDEQLKQHEEERHKPLICSECGKLFTSKYTLHKHEMNHNVRVTCEQCGRVYRSAEAFKKHVTDDVCSQKSKKSADQAIHQCDYCNKKYCYKPYLAKHIMHEHGNAKGYRCEYCNKQFYTQSRLKTHIVKHTREKNYVCDICNRRFVTKSSLLYHTRLHTGEKPYQCEHCDKAFLSASRRLDHMRRYHMKPTMACDLCQARFKTPGCLTKHRKRHFNPNSRFNNCSKEYII